MENSLIFHITHMIPFSIQFSTEVQEEMQILKHRPSAQLSDLHKWNNKANFQLHLEIWW